MKELFLSYIKNLRNLSQATCEAYERDITQFEKFLKSSGTSFERPDRNTGRSYSAYLRDLGLKPVSVNRKLTAVRVYYDYAVKTGKADFNPFERVKSLKTGRRLPDYLQHEEICNMRDTGENRDPVFTDLRNKALLSFLYSTGCRVSEAVKLDTEMLDLGNGTARVYGKGKKERIVYIGENSLSAIKSYFIHIGYMDAKGFSSVDTRWEPVPPLNGKGEKTAFKIKKGLPVFVNRNRKRLSERGVFYLVEKMAEEAGIGKNVSPHTIRHSFATHMVSEGADIRYVQEMLGHESLSTTQVYTHTGIGRLKEVYRAAHPHGRMEKDDRIKMRESVK